MVVNRKENGGPRVNPQGRKHLGLLMKLTSY